VQMNSSIQATGYGAFGQPHAMLLANVK